MARFPPLFPSAPFPVWVMVWVSGFPAQDLHRYKQERASCLKFRGGEAILSSTAQATHCRPGFWGHQFTHRWVGQAEHLACRKRPPGAFAGVARTHFCPEPSGVLKHRAAQQESTPVTAVPALCAGFGAGVGAVCLSAGFGGVGPRVERRLFEPSKSRERTPPGSPVWALWGCSILVLG